MKSVICFITFFAAFSHLHAQEIQRGTITDPIQTQFKTIFDLEIVFTHANMVSLHHNEIYRNMIVVVIGNRIHRVMCMENTEVPEGANIIKADGQYLLAGMLPYDWLEPQHSDRLITINKSLDRFRSFGDLEPGKLANFLLLPSNPLENEIAVNDLEGVMIRGLWYDRKELFENLNEVRLLYP